MNDATTIRMANQIAAFFKAYPHEEAVKEIADHINRFWEPRMRQAFFALLAKGGAGLDAAVKEAASLVKKPEDHAGPAAVHASAGQIAGGLEGGS
jgi:formate dehydrogenase subunit delta